jgi:site-specific recombinase XerD
MPVRLWPEVDRAAWDEAARAGHVLDGGGAAAHWAAATKKTNEQHYGGWLGFLSTTGRLQPGEHPGARVTRENVRSYIQHLKSELAPRTVVSTLVGLKVMMKAMVPDENWRWLEDICNALNRSSEPRNAKRSRIRPIEEIYSAATKELVRLLTTPVKRRIERVVYRDALMLAFLAARPLRLKNFTSLDIGGRFLRSGKGWLISIPGREVKNRQPLEFDLPDSLLPYVELYLNRVRPSFQKDRATQALWLTFEGRPMKAHSIHYRFIAKTKCLLGVSLNPHVLRDCAATSMATDSVAAALASGPLLGHRNFRTTEQSYIRANRLEASRRVNAAIQKLKA